MKQSINWPTPHTHAYISMYTTDKYNMIILMKNHYTKSS